MRPPFSLYGGKASLAPLIVSILPPHCVYLEPYAGSLAVLFCKSPSKIEIVNDIDNALVIFFRVLRDRPDELERACRLTPYARVEFYGANLTTPGLNDIEIARRFWVRVTQGFSGSPTAGWSCSATKYCSTASTVRRRVGEFHRIAERLAIVGIECCDAVDFIERKGMKEDVVIYSDPPYHALSRVSKDDYHAEMTGEDHRRLAKVLHTTPATVILSGYSSTLYDELYGDWWWMEVETTSVSSGAGRPRRVERIWVNRGMPHKGSS